MPDGQVFAEDKPSAQDLIPHNIEAEQAILGAILSDNECLHRVEDIIRIEHFYDPVHGRVFDAARMLVQRNDVADAITLGPFADQDEGLQALGGGDYLVELMAGACSTATAVDYAKFVRDLALRRELIRVGGDIEHDARADQEAPAPDLLERAERSLFSLAETGRTNKGFVGLNSALKVSVQTINAAVQKGGGLSGLSTGFSELDRLLGGLHPSDLIILAGRPSMGKTAFATNIAFNVAKQFRKEPDENGVTKTVSGGVVGFFSLEMSSEQLATRILSQESGISSHYLRTGEIESNQFEDVVDAAARIEQAPLHIDDTGGISIGQLSARARRLKRTLGLDLIVVDYLQLVTGSRTGGGDSNRVQEVTEVTQGLKAMAKELDVPVIALAQLSRQVEQRDDKRPQLSDLRESGSIEQDADAVMFVYRDEYYVKRREPRPDAPEYAEWEDEMNRVKNRAEIIISKQRHGPIDTVEVQFDQRLTRFADLAPEGHYLDPRAPAPGA